MNKILIIDENKELINQLKDDLSTYHVFGTYEILKAKSYSEVSSLVKQYSKDIKIAVVSKELPDAPAGKAVMLLSTNNIESVILYRYFDKDDKLDAKLLSINGVLGYFEKNDEKYIEKLVQFVHNKIRNPAYTALVVDDSLLYRQKFKNDLENLGLNVVCARDGQDALDIFESNEHDISLIITDYNMPNMDGIELVKRLRKKVQRDKLSIIAISVDEDNETLTKFLKAGANDYIKKPYIIEELDVRVDSNLTTLEMFEKISALANKDSLTGAYNRRYFFDVAKEIVPKNYNHNKPLVVATVDIDYFKKINDNYGHDIGDIAIKEVIDILQENIRKSDLLARFGGEEFCMLFENMSYEQTEAFFERVRKIFEDNTIVINKDLSINFTVSIGVSFDVCDDIAKMLKKSDKALYEAKESGRNKVVIYK